MARWQRRILIMLGPLLAALMPSVLTTAHPASPTANLAYATAFADARAQATSDFERTVLADDIITQAEYDEAVQRFIACLHDTGRSADISAEPDPLIPGAIVYRGTVNANIPPEVRQRILESCTDGTTKLIEPLSIAITVNPDNADFDELVLSCLHDHELVATDFDEAGLPALRNAASKATSRVNPSTVGTTLDDAVVTCLVNPMHIGLETMPATPSS